MKEDKWTCDEYYLNCEHRSNERDTSKEWGHVHKFFRPFCVSKGMLNGKPCIHAYKNDKRVRHSYKQRSGRTKTIKVGE